jgi:hypothetical protein
MILLHRKPNHKESDELERKLKNLVISFKTERHSADEKGLPFIEEDDVFYKTEEELAQWLSELKSDLDWQRSLTGDGCYINPKDGKIC